MRLINFIRNIIRKLFKKDKDKHDFKIPKSVQDTIPIRRVYEDGIFQVDNNKYSQTYVFTDINYAVASRDDKESMFLDYSEILNSLDSGADIKITIMNRRINKSDFNDNILLKMEDDDLDIYRKEYNQMLIDKASSANGIIQEKFITISFIKRTLLPSRRPSRCSWASGRGRRLPHRKNPHRPSSERRISPWTI